MANGDSLRTMPKGSDRRLSLSSEVLVVTGLACRFSGAWGGLLSSVVVLGRWRLAGPAWRKRAKARSRLGRRQAAASDKEPELHLSAGNGGAGGGSERRRKPRTREAGRQAGGRARAQEGASQLCAEPRFSCTSFLHTLTHRQTDREISSGSDPACLPASDAAGLLACLPPSSFLAGGGGERRPLSDISHRTTSSSSPFRPSGLGFGFGGPRDVPAAAAAVTGRAAPGAAAAAEEMPGEERRAGKQPRASPRGWRWLLLPSKEEELRRQAGRQARAGGGGGALCVCRNARLPGSAAGPTDSERASEEEEAAPEACRRARQIRSGFWGTRGKGWRGTRPGDLAGHLVSVPGNRSPPAGS